MSRKRLTTNHPTYKKLEQIFDLMDKIGISIDPYSSGVSQITITDKNFPGQIFDLRDLEDMNDCSYYPLAIPPNMEWKLLKEET